MFIKIVENSKDYTTISIRGWCPNYIEVVTKFVNLSEAWSLSPSSRTALNQMLQLQRKYEAKLDFNRLDQFYYSVKLVDCKMC